MKFGSVCSGIEAASVAWHPLGWSAAWLAEIEPFPSAVLAHHYPDVPNLGDMTALPGRIQSGEIEAPDVFCGGTPCQAFSVAGLRRSLDDARGNLSLTFCEIANAIDTVRAGRGDNPAIIFWENVPGVLSTKDNAFGCFLAGLAGEDGELEPSGGKWTNAGCVYGPQRAVAWRVLDAQYFGVAQRRRRVFVIASSRNDFDPAAVLFEFDGVRRDSAPSRQAGEVAPTIPARSLGGGGLGTDFDCDGGLIAKTLLKGGHSNNPLDENLVALAQGVTIHGTDGTATIASYSDLAQCLRARTPGNIDNSSTTVVQQPIPQPFTLAIRGRGDTHQLEYRQDGIANALLTPNGGRGGIGVGAVAQPIAWDNDLNASVDQMGTLIKGGAGGRHEGVAHPMATRDVAQTITSNYGKQCDNSDTALGPNVAIQHMAVRRLTPVECEKLQGFPHGYTMIPWRKKPASDCPDGPRYKALGNSWAVPVVAWIGRRIAAAVAKSDA